MPNLLSRQIRKITATMNTIQEVKNTNHRSFSIICGDVHCPLMMRFDESDWFIMFPGEKIYFPENFKNFYYFLAKYPNVTASSQFSFYIELGQDNYQDGPQNPLKTISYNGYAGSAVPANIVYAVPGIIDKMTEFPFASTSQLARISNIEKLVLTTNETLATDVVLDIMLISLSAASAGGGGRQYRTNVRLLAGVDNFIELNFPEKCGLVGFVISSVTVPSTAELMINAEGRWNIDQYEVCRGGVA